jgi:TolB protein
MAKDIRPRRGDHAFLTRRERLRRGLIIATSAAIVSATAGIAPWRALAQPRDDTGGSDTMRIAIVFVADGAPDGDMVRDVARIITDNLARSGRFSPIDPAVLMEKIAGFDTVPRFDDLRAVNVKCLVTGRITRQPDDRLRAEFRLWDVAAGAQLVGRQYFMSTRQAQLIADIISDDVYERLTGRKGNFESGGGR